MKKGILILLFFCISGVLYAQEVLMHEDVEQDTISSKFGKNRLNYIHTYMGIGWPFGNSEGAGGDVKLIQSINLEYGIRYKLRVCNHYAMGLNMAYSRYAYRLEQDKGKILPDTILHSKERVAFNNFQLGYYNRINFGKRGDYIGNFIDIGAYGEYTPTFKHFFKDKKSDGTITRTSISRTAYHNDINYGVFLNIGFNKITFTFKYRLSDMFVPSYNYPEMPRLTAGLQWGLHK